MQPNGVHHIDKSVHYALIIVCSIFFGLAVLATSGRIYSRTLISHNYGAEDTLMILSLVFSAVHFATGLATMRYGVGEHMEEVDLARFEAIILKYTIVSGVIFVVAMGTVKTSVLVFYFRTLPVRAFRRAVLLLLFIIAGYTISCTIVLIFSCHPFRRAWDPTVQEGGCINRFAVYYFQAAMNIATDVATILLPVPLIWKLHIARREKVIIFMLIAVSLFGTGVGSARFKAIQMLQGSGDLTWATGLGIIFGQVELNPEIIGEASHTTSTALEHVASARGATHNETNMEIIDESSMSLVRRADTNEPFPDGGTRSWLVVLGSFLLLLASYGLMNSVGVLQSYLESNQLADYSSRDIGWISGLFVFISLGGGVFVGPMFDTYGPRALVFAGTAIYALSLFLVAQCSKYWHFILCFGVLAGIGAALVSTVAMASVPHWFQVRAGMALGTAMAGAGLGGVVFPFLLKGAFAKLGFAWGMRILAFVIFFACSLGSFLVKSRLPKGNTLKAAIDVRCFTDSRFTWLTVGIFSLELEVFALIGLFPTFIVMQGFSVDSSVNLLAVLNVCSCVGRLIAGRVGDRYGRLNVLIILITSAVFAIFVVLYPFRRSLPALYVFSAIYGLCSGSFISLAPVCIRQVSPAKEIGMRFGTCYCLVSFATLICIPIGGEMLEKVGPGVVVLWLGGVLCLSMLFFLTARWACLDYKWNWKIKV
ncbi:hypothetical protein FE257_000806 [Aspergillus nanangensis]|uniref:Major facilitator superfamily (MFS) profile domain-containing protein n=1 Tax=Aspergillus nanangensis TaxID=2582783 RepID=A0AAD4CER5_ASPNN|nr:hypothetical protein FE257_000806 [Aspergillus nanangensis]